MIKIPALHGSTIIGTHKPVSDYPFTLQNALATRLTYLLASVPPTMKTQNSVTVYVFLSWFYYFKT